jgi:hypothetical protein
LQVKCGFEALLKLSLLTGIAKMLSFCCENANQLRDNPMVNTGHVGVTPYKT